jgi:protease-4
MEFSNIEELMRKIGLKTEIIKSGKYKDIGIPTRSLTEEEKEVLKRLIDDVYEQFVQAVSKGRNLPVEKVRRLADGRIFSGKQAKKLGLIDSLGGLQDAISEISKMVGIEDEPKIIREKPRKGFLYKLLEEKIFKLDIFDKSKHSSKFKLQYIWPY